MVYSMTAYARKEINQSWGQAAVEIRSVNQRYLETVVRSPDQFRALESLFRDRFKETLSRGKIECTLRVDFDKSAENTISLNEPFAKQILSAADSLKKTYSDNMSTISPIEVLRWPGVIAAKEQNLDELSPLLIALFNECLTEFIEMRSREGEALKLLLIQRLDAIKIEIDKIYTEMPAIIVWQKQKLTTRLAEAGLDPENNRVEQELILMAQRMDVAEELDRLLTHVNETKRILSKNEAIGRRLDFIMQEFNREANTIASKSINMSVTSSAIELKVLIEQMREQIQNIE